MCIYGIFWLYTVASVHAGAPCSGAVNFTPAFANPLPLS